MLSGLSASNELSAVSAGNAPAASAASSLVHSHGQCAGLQPEDEGNTDSGVESSVPDTEASQASTLLACLLLACQAFILSSRYRRHPRSSVRIASESESRSWSASRFWAPLTPRVPDPQQSPALTALGTARWAGCTYRRKRLSRLGLHRGCTRGSHRIQALTGTVTLLTPAAKRLEWLQSSHS